MNTEPSPPKSDPPPLPAGSASSRGSPELHLAGRILLPVFSIGFALVLALLWRRWGNDWPLIAPFFMAIMLTVWFGGRRAGFVSVVLAILVFDFFLTRPYYSFAVTAEDLPSFLAFIIFALLAGWFSGARRRAEGALLEAQHLLEDKVAARTRELTNANAALQSEIAERKKAQEVIEGTRAQLAQVSRVMTLGELTASIAHEVNQPLTAITTNANASLRWLDGETPDLDEARQAMERIVKEGHRAGEVVHRVRALVKKGPPVRLEIRLNEVIHEVSSLVLHELMRKNVSLRLEQANELPVVSGDRVQIQQVVLNLVMNAIEAMDPVTDRAKELIVRTLVHGPEEIKVEVKDTGIGFDPKEVDRLFTAFYTTKPEGMGMGLSISRSIIEAHGGRLWAAAHLPYGAVFQFTLPVGRAGEPGRTGRDRIQAVPPLHEPSGSGSPSSPSPQD